MKHVSTQHDLLMLLTRFSPVRLLAPHSTFGMYFPRSLDIREARGPSLSPLSSMHVGRCAVSEGGSESCWKEMVDLAIQSVTAICKVAKFIKKCEEVLEPTSTPCLSFPALRIYLLTSRTPATRVCCIRAPPRNVQEHPPGVDRTQHELCLGGL